MNRQRYHSCKRPANENHTSLEEITQTKAAITQNSYIFPLNCGNLAVNICVITF
jgi:hypothetical protein